MHLLALFFSRVIERGRLSVLDARGRSYTFGSLPGPDVTMRIHDPAVATRIVLNPEMAIGEAYMDGTVTFDGNGSLEDFLSLFYINPLPAGWSAVQDLVSRLWRRIQPPTARRHLSRSRRAVAHHYDLSRRLFELFLDEDMHYSCALFGHDGDSLETAQNNKTALIASKLLLRPGLRVLDIGSGWGGLALALARTADVEVTGITLSREQLAVANERAAAAGLGHRVRFELKDYRELCGRYDRIVSVGMFEHVGADNYDTFFRTVYERLTEDGVALLHSIGRRNPPGRRSPWLDKYIFPDGYTPSLSEVLAATERQRLWVTDIEILRLHYARTLEEWHQRFQQNRARIAELYDERFCRMWEFYLLGARSVFLHGDSMVFHLQMARRRDAVPLTRDYLFEAPSQPIQVNH